MDKSTDELYEKMEKCDQYKVLFAWNLCSSYWNQLKVNIVLLHPVVFAL